jgi:hypothetical protein
VLARLTWTLAGNLVGRYTVGVLPRVRALLLAVLVIGLLGTLVELLLLAHYEDALQQIPVVLLAGCLVIVARHAARPSKSTVRMLQGTMMLLLAAGTAGVAFHFNGAAEFQREIDPSLSAGALFARVIRVHAPPLLAPGSLLQLALVGLIHTYQHPRLIRGNAQT